MVPDVRLGPLAPREEPPAGGVERGLPQLLGVRAEADQGREPGQDRADPEPVRGLTLRVAEVEPPGVGVPVERRGRVPRLAESRAVDDPEPDHLPARFLGGEPFAAFGGLGDDPAFLGEPGGGAFAAFGGLGGDPAFLGEPGGPGGVGGLGVGLDLEVGREHRPGRRGDQDRRRQDGNRRVPPTPADGLLGPGLATRPDRSIFEPAAEVVGHRLAIGVAIGGGLGHRLQADRLEVSGDARLDRAGRLGLFFRHLEQDDLGGPENGVWPVSSS